MAFLIMNSQIWQNLTVIFMFTICIFLGLQISVFLYRRRLLIQPLVNDRVIMYINHTAGGHRKEAGCAHCNNVYKPQSRWTQDRGGDTAWLHAEHIISSKPLTVAQCTDPAVQIILALLVERYSTNSYHWVSDSNSDRKCLLASCSVYT